MLAVSKPSLCVQRRTLSVARAPRVSSRIAAHKHDDSQHTLVNQWMVHLGTAAGFCLSASGAKAAVEVSF